MPGGKGIVLLPPSSRPVVANQLPEYAFKVGHRPSSQASKQSLKPHKDENVFRGFTFQGQEGTDYVAPAKKTGRRVGLLTALVLEVLEHPQQRLLLREEEAREVLPVAEAVSLVPWIWEKRLGERVDVVHIIASWPVRWKPKTTEGSTRIIEASFGSLGRTGSKTHGRPDNGRGTISLQYATSPTAWERVGRATGLARMCGGWLNQRLTSAWGHPARLLPPQISRPWR